MNQNDPTPSSDRIPAPSGPTPPRRDQLPAALTNPHLPCYIEVDLQSPLGVLIVTVRDHLRRLGKDQGRHKKETTTITMLTVGLSAASSVLLGLSFKDPLTSVLEPVYLKNTALLFTAIIAVVNAYDALFRPRRLWVREAKSYGLLKDILLKLELRAASIVPGQPVTAEEVEAFRAEIAKLLQEDLEAWVRQHGEELLVAAKISTPSTTPPPTPTPASQPAAPPTTPPLGL